MSGTWWSTTDIAYVDPIAVEKAAAGYAVRMTPAERRAAVQLLTGRRYSAQEIAARMRISTRTVVRYRARQAEVVSTFGQ